MNTKKHKKSSKKYIGYRGKTKHTRKKRLKKRRKRSKMKKGGMESGPQSDGFIYVPEAPSPAPAPPQALSHFFSPETVVISPNTGEPGVDPSAPTPTQLASPPQGLPNPLIVPANPAPLTVFGFDATTLDHRIADLETENELLKQRLEGTQTTRRKYKKPTKISKEEEKEKHEIESLIMKGEKYEISSDGNNTLSRIYVPNDKLIIYNDTPWTISFLVKVVIGSNPRRIKIDLILSVIKPYSWWINTIPINDFIKNKLSNIDTKWQLEGGGGYYLNYYTRSWQVGDGGRSGWMGRDARGEKEWHNPEMENGLSRIFILEETNEYKKIPFKKKILSEIERIKDIGGWDKINMPRSIISTSSLNNSSLCMGRHLWNSPYSAGPPGSGWSSISGRGQQEMVKSLINEYENIDGERFPIKLDNDVWQAVCGDTPTLIQKRIEEHYKGENGNWVRDGWKSFEEIIKKIK